MFLEEILNKDWGLVVLWFSLKDDEIRLREPKPLIEQEPRMV